MHTWYCGRCRAFHVSPGHVGLIPKVYTGGSGTSIPSHAIGFDAPSKWSKPLLPDPAPTVIDQAGGAPSGGYAPIWEPEPQPPPAQPEGPWGPSAAQQPADPYAQPYQAEASPAPMRPLAPAPVPSEPELPPGEAEDDALADVMKKVSVWRAVAITLAAVAAGGVIVWAVARPGADRT